MAGLVCSECSKPALPGAKVCRWCKSPLTEKKPVPTPSEAEETGGKLPPSLEAELQEIRDWTGPAREIAVAPVSIRTCISLAVMIAGLGVGIATSNKDIAPKIFGYLGGGVSVLFVLVWGWQDLEAVGSRARRTPRDGALACFLRLKAKQYGAARAAIADYPLAEKRHAQLKGRWKERLTGSYEINAVTINKVTKLRPDAFTVSLRIDMRAGSLPGLLVGMFAGCLVGVILYYVMAKKDSIVMEKLVLLRDERWYLVNALPEDRTDRRLIRALSATGKSEPQS